MVIHVISFNRDFDAMTVSSMSAWYSFTNVNHLWSKKNGAVTIVDVNTRFLTNRDVAPGFLSLKKNPKAVPDFIAIYTTTRFISENPKNDA